MERRGNKLRGPAKTAETSRDGRIDDAPSKDILRPGQETRGSAHPVAHPALSRLSGVLGREAAAFARRYRYAGLGRLQLIWSQIQEDHEGYRK
jgi:hypothetical protein